MLRNYNVVNKRNKTERDAPTTGFRKLQRPTEQEHISKRELASRLLRQLHPAEILASLVEFCRRVPHFIWVFFIPSFLVPAYRPEWSRYSKWQADSGAENDDIDEPEAPRTPARKRRKTGIKLASKCPEPVKHNHSLCQIIEINVSGKIYQTQLKSLAFFPETLLGDPKRREQFYDPTRNDYFIDRSRSCFDAIFYYYQSRGILRRPNTVSLPMFEEEVRFFDLGHEVIERLRREEGLLVDMEQPVPHHMLQRKLWLLMEYPNSSLQARIVAILSISTVLVSIFIFCLETMEDYDKMLNKEYFQDSVMALNDPFNFTETACISWFVFEFVIRWANAPKKFAFIKSISNIIDLLAIVPYFVSLIVALQESSLNGSQVNSFYLFRVIRLVRVFRILKLSRHNRGLKVLGKTLKASMRELALLMFFLIIGVVLFSSGVYFAEVNHPRTYFSSILDAFWWSVITMTTCGYGDDVPLTIPGKLVGALCAICGVLTLALPVPVIVSNFNNFYTREEDTVQAQVDIEHVAQCPCRSGKFVDGAPAIMSSESHLNIKMLGMVTGRNQPDDSDSDFEPLKKVDYENSAEFRQRIRKLRKLANDKNNSLSVERKHKQ